MKYIHKKYSEGQEPVFEFADKPTKNHGPGYSISNQDHSIDNKSTEIPLSFEDLQDPELAYYLSRHLEAEPGKVFNSSFQDEPIQVHVTDKNKLVPAKLATNKATNKTYFSPIAPGFDDFDQLEDYFTNTKKSLVSSIKSIDSLTKGLEDLTPESNPEYFSPVGQLLSRKPGENLEWNTNYPQDNWLGKWTDEQGQYNYTYNHEDIVNNPKFLIHRQNCLIDSKLQEFRTYTNTLFQSEFIKDQIMALILSLIDQGHLQLNTITNLLVKNVVFENSLIRLGTRYIYPDKRITALLLDLTLDKDPESPVFIIPNDNIGTKIGPNLIKEVLKSLNTPINAFYTYHINNTYSSALTKYLFIYDLNYEDAKSLVLFETTNEFNHEIGKVNFEHNLLGFQAMFIDPLLTEIFEKHFGTKQGRSLEEINLPKLGRPVKDIDSTLNSKKQEEQEFGDVLLHNIPLHEYW